MSELFQSLPDGWHLKALGDICNIDPEMLSGATDPNYTFRYIDISSVGPSKISNNLTLEVFRSAPSRARKRVQKDDVLMATVRPNLKAFAKVGLDGELVASTGFAVLRAIKDKSHPEFLKQILFSADIESQVESLVAGSNYPAITVGNVRRLHVAVPPYAEQRGIAEVLSALDEQIELTEALVIKKTEVKRALAMTLMSKPNGLTGEKWQEASFGALVVSVRDKFLPTEQERAVPCINLEDVPEGEGRVSGFTSAANNLSTKTAFKKGDILFGKLRPYLRKFAVAPFDGVCTTEILVFRAVKDVDRDFVFQVVASDAFIEHNVAISYGTKMPRTDWQTVASFPVAKPRLDEQRVIGQVLSAADADLAGLRTEAAKLRLQKIGLMRDLLTGKTRIQ